jgi:aerobic carbon-monoxide dehydrogenase small subunit
MKPITLTVNGRAVVASVEPRTHLADFLRETQGLTGTHLGCEHGICGACTLLVDGVPVRSCITWAVACDGADVTTIEGLDDDEIARELRTAFSREHALQCGYCTPGMLIAARDLAIRADRADEREIRVAMSGNLCRCTGYVGIIRAVMGVIEERRVRGIPALPGAGRTAIGPAGSGHVRTRDDTLVQGPRDAGATPSRSNEAPRASAELTDDFQPQATFAQSFIVHHPRAEVWAFFARVRDVAACLPGASVTGGDDTNVAGRMRVKVGPIAGEFDGIAVVARDPATWSGTIRGHGRDLRSGSATRGAISYRLEAETDPGATRVDITIGYSLTGALAQFSRTGLVKEIVDRIAKTFAENLEVRLAGGAAVPSPAAELRMGALVLSAAAARVKAWFGRLFHRRARGRDGD